MPADSACTDGSSSAPWREFAETEIHALVETIEHSGYAVIDQYITADDLDDLQQFVGGAVEKAGNSSVILKGHGPVADTALGRIAYSPAIKRLCMRAYEQLTSQPGPDSKYYQILRCLTGETAQEHSMIFHFDSFVLTLLLPIAVPEGKDNGELIVLPNIRPVRRWYTSNLFDKVLLDNAFTQWLLRSMIRKGSKRFVRIALEPGKLYLFWGYRSVHANAPCDVDKIRATALFHYADPHSSSALKKLLGRETKPPDD